MNLTMLTWAQSKLKKSTRLFIPLPDWFAFTTTTTKSSLHSQKIPNDGLTLRHFIQSPSMTGPFSSPIAVVNDGLTSPTSITEKDVEKDQTPRMTIGHERRITSYTDFDEETLQDSPITAIPTFPSSLSVYIETYGCQMNVNDTEVVRSILLKSGFDLYSAKATNLATADIILLMTCAIRENAESKIWARLDVIRAQRRSTTSLSKSMIGILGCMAERLKGLLVEGEKGVHIVCGPDAYRDLPRLLNHSLLSNGQSAMNVQLSLDETYAEIKPVRLDSEKKSAFVSIMRGCDNMCSYCIVPFTRGKERSRPLLSIAREVGELVNNEDVKEITLLGQNVNSYRDIATPLSIPGSHQPAFGFRTIYRPKEGGARFTELLDVLSTSYPNTRFRFTSPHPKDFPEVLLHLMAARPNICKYIHLPAQSGSSSVLDRMRRGYTRETYLSLVENILKIIPTCTLSSDFISGFCGETDDDHHQTLSLINSVPYDMAYMFAYSKRDKTHAARHFEDNISDQVKKERLKEIVNTFYGNAEVRGRNYWTGREEIVLVDGPSRKNPDEWCGRTDGNKMVILSKSLIESTDHSFNRMYQSIIPGAYVKVKIIDSNATTLFAKVIHICSSLSGRSI